MPKRSKPPGATGFDPAWTYRSDSLRLRHLRLLKLVDQRGSLGAAARGLGVSQPAATLLLRELEAVFGSTLVERDARGARLTTSGRHAVDRLTIALASLEQAIQAARTPETAPLLRLGCIQVASMSGLPAAINRLVETNTLGRLQIREGRARDLLADLCAGDLDCVIGWIDETLIEGLPVEGLQIEQLSYGRMQVAAAVSHPLARLRAVSVEEIGRWRWIVPSPGSRTYAAYLRLFVHNGVPAPPATVECSALHTTLHIVSATQLLAMAPSAAVRHYSRLGMVKPLRGTALSLDYNQISVVTRRDGAAFLPLQNLKKALLAEADRAEPPR